MAEYYPVIGLEVHAQLATRTKLFCSCPVEFGEDPNKNVCPICLGMPGVLPVPNEHAIELAVKMGLATECSIDTQAMWTRKNYFYPDLPKGYQVTQQGENPVYDRPICKNGKLEIEGEWGSKIIGITRMHLEEDAGKLIHDLSPDSSLFDANRCGTPLLEMVSEPDIRSAGEAVAYLKKMKQLLEYLGVSDANMEKGNLRCDVNISLRKSESDPFGTKVEMKNMNSFSNIEKAIEAEIELQTMTLDKGEQVQQVTKRYDPDRDVTVAMRSKEQAQDYRYFPEPDLIPLGMVTEEYIEDAKQQLPELPADKYRRYIDEYQLSEYDAGVLTADKDIAMYFEKVCTQTSQYKVVANWVQGSILSLVKETETSILKIPIGPERLGALLKLLEQDTISGRIAKDVFQEMLQSDKEPETIVEEKGWKVVNDEGPIREVVEQLVQEHSAQAEEYRGGKVKLLGFFVGQVMKATKGQAGPDVVNKIIKEVLGEPAS
jgi:aspartyl-tRNA(Asn)/glutamyl-tRNA(Gln) amidotransferase subunit B